MALRRRVERGIHEAEIGRERRALRAELRHGVVQRLQHKGIVGASEDDGTDRRVAARCAMLFDERDQVGAGDGVRGRRTGLHRVREARASLVEDRDVLRHAARLELGADRPGIGAGGDRAGRRHHADCERRRIGPDGKLVERGADACLDNAHHLRAVADRREVAADVLQTPRRRRVAGNDDDLHALLRAARHVLFRGLVVAGAEQELGVLQDQLAQVVALALRRIVAVRHVGLVAEVHEMLPREVGHAVGTVQPRRVVDLVHVQQALKDGQTAQPGIKHADRRLVALVGTARRAIRYKGRACRGQKQNRKSHFCHFQILSSSETTRL